ncbi:hypothetical protein L596_010352 [Steinernema carpocapsae]|uniref:Uncharacterized protein n=1 Tax=Steinernema carpocapsae TaxID=34508 RepID=A0A4U5PJE7_STECR|nr:hypothetical protein L596_010352 [Steinernema carpocapsae]
MLKVIRLPLSIPPSIDPSSSLCRHHRLITTDLRDKISFVDHSWSVLLLERRRNRYLDDWRTVHGQICPIDFLCRDQRKALYSKHKFYANDSVAAANTLILPPINEVSDSSMESRCFHTGPLSTALKEPPLQLLWCTMAVEIDCDVLDFEDVVVS